MRPVPMFRSLGYFRKGRKRLNHETKTFVLWFCIEFRILVEKRTLGFRHTQTLVKNPWETPKHFPSPSSPQPVPQKPLFPKKENIPRNGNIILL